MIATQHTGDLCGTGVSCHLVQVRLGNVAGLLAHHVMFIGHDGNLRQVGYDNHLMRSGEICKHTREHVR